MNDYIDRLIGRSLNKSQVIQPRLPAIFEPQRIDEPVLSKAKVNIEPLYHSSPEEVLIAPQPDGDKQIPSADSVITMIKSIKSGKNNWRSHTSDQSESSIQNGLTDADRNEFEEPISLLNFVHARTEYPDEFMDMKADKNMTNENMNHEISFRPDNKHIVNADIIRSTNVIDQTIEESGTEESISNEAETQESENKTQEKKSERFILSHSLKNEMTIQQYEEKTKSWSDHRIGGKFNHNSNIENVNQTFSQKHSDQKNGVQNPNNPESANDPFKGKLVTRSGIQWNNKTSVVSNDNSKQQESIIRVNIGRIEVRAVQSPLPPSPPQRKQIKPLLSLDDYLSQRNGG